MTPTELFEAMGYAVAEEASDIQILSHIGYHASLYDAQCYVEDGLHEAMKRPFVIHNLQGCTFLSTEQITDVTVTK